MKHKREFLEIINRFFHPDKSPHTIIHFDKFTGLPRYDYVPKNKKREGTIIPAKEYKKYLLRQKTF